MSEYSETLAVLDTKPTAELFTPTEREHMRTVAPERLNDVLGLRPQVESLLYWPELNIVAHPKEWAAVMGVNQDKLMGARTTILDAYLRDRSEAPRKFWGDEFPADPRFDRGGSPSVVTDRSNVAQAWADLIRQGLTVDGAVEYVCVGEVEDRTHFLDWVVRVRGGRTSHLTGAQYRELDRALRAGVPVTQAARNTGYSVPAAMNHAAVIGRKPTRTLAPAKQQFVDRIITLLREDAQNFRVAYRQASEELGALMTEAAARRRCAGASLVAA